MMETTLKIEEIMLMIMLEIAIILILRITKRMLQNKDKNMMLAIMILKIIIMPKILLKKEIMLNILV